VDLFSLDSIFLAVYLEHFWSFDNRSWRLFFRLISELQR